MVPLNLRENVYKDKYDPNKFIAVYDNVIVAFGGDGTLIKAIHKYKDLGIPFYGQSGGTVGFMMNPKEPIYYPKPMIINLNLIKVKVTYRVQKGTITFNEYKEYQAFNDICLGGDPRIWAEFTINEKDNMFGRIKGSGLIVSTPQGSTAISKNNGGSVLPLDTNLWSITGDKTDRQIDYVIKPRKMEILIDSRQAVPLLIDGTNKIIEDVISVEIVKGDKIQLVFGDYAEFIKKRRT